MSELEKRVPLLERVERGAWTKFESTLFNALIDELPRDFLFSRRLAATQAALDAIDRYVELERIAE